MQPIQMPWLALRSAVTADDTALSAFNYDNWPSSGTIALGIGAPNGQSDLNDARRWLIAMCGIGNANSTFSYKLYGRKRANGPIMLVASGVATLGAQVVTKDPITKATSTAKWVDTITITAGLWSDLAPLIVDSGNDRIAYMRGRPEGLRDLYLEIDLDGDGLGSYATSASAIITGSEED